MKAEIDHLLAPVAKACRHVSNEILDLREAVMTRSNPGDCVNCYFKIYDVLAHQNQSALTHLRQWLEKHLIVIAKDEEARVLERLPISLHHSDMESFCHEVMEEFRMNRSYANTLIELSLHFSEESAA